MIGLLLDEHVPLAVAKGLKLRRPELQVRTVPEWEGGRLRGRSDEELLVAAAAMGLVLVTYDLRTIPPLLREWGRGGQDHHGVIFCNAKTISQREIGLLVRQLARICAVSADEDWTNRVEFLEKG